jgi:hypothetical protein
VPARAALACAVAAAACVGDAAAVCWPSIIGR